MNASIPFFLLAFAYLSFCSPTTPTTRGNVQRATMGTGNSTPGLLNETNSALTNGGVANGTSGLNNGSGSGGGFNNGGGDGNPLNFNPNQRPTDTQTSALTMITTDIGFVGGADCNTHINKLPGDLCRYDFCGDANANSFLSSGEYQTVLALVAALKAQNKFPSGTCSDANVISALKNLTTLDISGKGLTDLSPLKQLTLLQSLNIENNQITDLSALANMTLLQKLYADNNSINDLTGLSTDTSLQELYLSHNQITSIEPLVTLPKLVSLDISNNQVGSIISLTNRTIGINITGNPGILLEAQSYTATTTNVDESNCASKLLSNFVGAMSCTWNTANIQLNEVSGNTPLPTK